MKITRTVGTAVAIIFTLIGLWSVISGASGLYTDFKFLRLARLQYEQQQRQRATAPAAAPQAAKPPSAPTQ